MHSQGVHADIVHAGFVRLEDIVRGLEPVWRRKTAASLLIVRSGWHGAGDVSREHVHCAAHDDGFRRCWVQAGHEGQSVCNVVSHVLGSHQLGGLVARAEPRHHQCHSTYTILASSLKGVHGSERPRVQRQGLGLSTAEVGTYTLNPFHKH